MGVGGGVGAMVGVVVGVVFVLLVVLVVVEKQLFRRQRHGRRVLGSQGVQSRAIVGGLSSNSGV